MIVTKVLDSITSRGRCKGLRSQAIYASIILPSQLSLCHKGFTIGFVINMTLVGLWLGL